MPMAARRRRRTAAAVGGAVVVAHGHNRRADRRDDRRDDRGDRAMTTAATDSRTWFRSTSVTGTTWAQKMCARGAEVPVSICGRRDSFMTATPENARIAGLPTTIGDRHGRRRGRSHTRRPTG